MNPTLDILFRVVGVEVPADHGYALFSALSRILETETDRWMHGNPHIGLHTIGGAPLGNGRRLIGRNARLGLRLPSDVLPRALFDAEIARQTAALGHPAWPTDAVVLGEVKWMARTL